MTTASGGDCIYVLLVCENQKDILWFRLAALRSGMNVLC
jgi:hypothetical protein